MRRKWLLILLMAIGGAGWSLDRCAGSEPSSYVCPHCGRVHSTADGHDGRGYSNGVSNNSGYGLPRGRRYYNGGRYFGNFNNRYYGPQYGYF